MVLLHEDAVVLLVGRALRELPVQLPQCDLLLDHGHATLLLQIVREELGRDDGEGVDGLLAGEQADAERRHLALEPAHAVADVPAHDVVLGGLGTPRGDDVDLADDERHPLAVLLGKHDLAGLEEQPEPLKGGGRRVVHVAALLIAELLAERSVEEAEEEVDVLDGCLLVLGAVVGRLARLVPVQGVAVVDQDAVRGWDHDAVADELGAGVVADDGAERALEVLGVDDHLGRLDLVHVEALVVRLRVGRVVGIDVIRAVGRARSTAIADPDPTRTPDAGLDLGDDLDDGPRLGHIVILATVLGNVDGLVAFAGYQSCAPLARTKRESLTKLLHRHSKEGGGGGGC